MREWTREKLAHADTDPVLVVENVTPEGFMEHLESLRHQRTGGRLSKSQHGNKRAALHHLFRCHVGLDGCPDGFKDRLSNLMLGFARVLRQRDQDDGGDVSVGKVAMSVDLCLALCAWFLSEGRMEGIWCHCFPVLTWNLMCHVMSLAMNWALASDGLTALLAPFIIKPSVSFSMSNLASPFSSFFQEIGSLPLRCPAEISSGGGNVEWMACSAARDTRQMRDQSSFSTAPKTWSLMQMPTDVCSADSGGAVPGRLGWPAQVWRP
jgi:hypothetical protein